MSDQNSNLKKSAWPESSLSKNERRFFSISLGNSSINWAFHGEKSENCNPTFFWRTPMLSLEDVECETPEELVKIFFRYLPKGEVGNFFFGNGEQNLQSALEENNRRGHLPTYYLVSTNSTQTDLFSRLVSCLPCRAIELQPDDLFSEAEGAYKGIGLDRLACLRGAMCVTGLPALVIDGGTALTYTAADQNGMIIGGGITCGMRLRLQALEEHASALPALNVEAEISRILDEATKSCTPADIFAKNTKDAMIIGALVEVSSFVRNVIEVWMNKVGSPKKRKNGEGTENGKKKRGDFTKNHKRIVAVAGGSGNLIARLLDEDDGGVLGTSPKPQIPTKHCGGLIHFGISWVLCAKSNQTQNVARFTNTSGQDKNMSANKKKKWMKYVGESVIKDFNPNNASGDGDSQTFKGQVVSFSLWENKEDGNKEYPLFRIVYSDGDEEDVDLTEVKSKCYLSATFFAYENHNRSQLVLCCNSFDERV